MAVDILGHFLAAHVTLITADDQAEVISCPKPLRFATGDTENLAEVGYG